MKGITCCGDCGYYNWEKHKCTRATDKGDAKDSFYADCPLPDVVEAQEPRVLTLDEADDADVCWLEVNGIERTPPCRVALFRPTGTCTIRRIGASNEEALAVDYGVTWRCWSARPTQERRGAVKWDD